MNGKRRRELARLAKAATGPVFRQDLLCMACHAELEAVYRHAAEVIVCPACGKRAAVRDDDDVPYPPPWQPREV